VHPPPNAIQDIDLIGFYNWPKPETRSIQQADMDVSAGISKNIERYQYLMRIKWRATPNEDEHYIYAVALL
jgi:hypothetical protein